jgi:hypothetical protein
MLGPFPGPMLTLINPVERADRSTLPSGSGLPNLPYASPATDQQAGRRPLPRKVVTFDDVINVAPARSSAAGLTCRLMLS